MKRIRSLIIFLGLLLLLASCSQKQEVTLPTATSTTAPATESTEEPTTAPPTVPTDVPTTEPVTEPVTEPSEPEFTPELWKPNGNHLSYKEYFSKDRFFGYVKTNSWIVSEEDNGYLFTLDVNAGLTITSEALSGSYRVPNSFATLSSYKDLEFVGTDGRTAYFANTTQIISIDLETGEDTELIAAEKLQNVYMGCGTVLYYIRYVYNTPYICRMYAPEVREDILYILNDPYYHLTLSRPLSSQGLVKWSGVNPAMLERLKMELSDPNSPYQKDAYYDYSYLWQVEDLLEDTSYQYFNSLVSILRNLQADTGIHAEIQGRYDCFTGAYTEQTGAMDDCWQGTNLPHDHFGWETTESELPTVIRSDWQSISLGEVAQSLEALVYDHWYTDDAGYFLTDSGSVISVPMDGGKAEVVYTARYGRLEDIHFQRIKGLGDTPYLCLLDGNRYVVIDPENGQCRDVLKHDHFHETMRWTDGRLYVCIVDGMFFQQYLIDLETGEFEETFFI